MPLNFMHFWEILLRVKSIRENYHRETKKRIKERSKAKNSRNRADEKIGRNKKETNVGKRNKYS